MLAVYHCFVDLLTCCGDVEENPGPNTEEMLRSLMKDMKEIKATISASSLKLNETTQKLTSIETKLDGLSSTVCDYTSRVDDLQKTVDQLILKVDDLENRSRRNNLIIYGITEPQGEQLESLEEVTQKILRDTLSVHDVKIERIHRLGKPNPSKDRPVIFKLVDGRDKPGILKNCRKLKGTNYSISEDFSPRIQAIRKKLWEVTKENRERGEKVALLFDKVKINTKLFRWDEGSNMMVPLHSE